MKEDLLTIKEFAEAAGITQQAVYQRLNKSLQSYVVVLSGKKHLRKEALSLFEKVEQPTDSSKVEQDSFKVEQGLIDTLQTTITLLQDQLKTKDDQIAELNARLKEALELNKGQVLLSVAEKQQLPAPQEDTTTETTAAKPGFWSRVKSWWE